MADILDELGAYILRNLRLFAHPDQSHVQGADVGWRGKIRIDGTMFSWMGHDNDSPTANITGLQLTPTRTIYTMQVGPISLNVTFLSPIEVRNVAVCDYSCPCLGLMLSADMRSRIAFRLDEAVSPVLLCGR